MIEMPWREAISRRLRLSPNMVRTHKENVQVRLGVHSDVAAVSVALEARLRPGYRRLES
jgi:DNA-binding CsgD family transcriptional regulator